MIRGRSAADDFLFDLVDDIREIDALAGYRHQGGGTSIRPSRGGYDRLSHLCGESQECYDR
jgi:hypothetical protein